MTGQLNQLPSKEEAERIYEQVLREFHRQQFEEMIVHFYSQLTPIEQLLQRIRLMQELKERQ